MALPVASDLFNRANANVLGAADTGQTWATLIGTMQIQDNRARSSSSARAFAALDAGVGGGNVTVEADCGYGNAQGGYALYFRVSDASNWWRLSVNAGSYTYQSGTQNQPYYTNGWTEWDGTYVWFNAQGNYTSESTSWILNGNYYAVPGDPFYAPGGHYIYNTTDWPAAGNWRGAPASGLLIEQCITTAAHLVQQHNHRNIGPGMRDVAGWWTDNWVPTYATAYTWTLTLEKMVAGTLSMVTSTGLSYPPTHLKVVANNSILTGYCATTGVGAITQQFQVTDGFNAAATLHGVGYGETTSYGNGDGLDAFAILVANAAPYAATSLSPGSNAPLSRGILQRLSWVFSDPDSGDSQSKYDLQYRLGTGAWTTVTTATPNNFWDAPASTFLVGTYEWQVRTYDALGIVGPWSASAFFAAADSPGLPSIIAPTSGGTVPEVTVLTWSVPLQTNYEVRRVADLSGIANTSTIYEDTGDVADAVVRNAPLAFAVNDRWEHLQVRVKISGLWSDWASIRVHVAYTPPMIPIPTVVNDIGGAKINLSISNPASVSGEPVVTSNDVFIASKGIPEYRAATLIAPNSVWIWPTPGAKRVYEIRVVAYGANGTTSSSE